jgi:hypothetical protein
MDLEAFKLDSAVLKDNERVFLDLGVEKYFLHRTEQQ